MDVDVFDVFELDVRCVLLEDMLNGEGDEVGELSRRRSLSLSLSGEGLMLSSIMSTQPEVSPSRAAFRSYSKSALCLFNLVFSGVLNSDDPFGIPWLVAVAGAVSDFFMEILPIRKRGTRVCSRCSRFLTRARISETICTPLLFEAVADDVLALVGKREAGGKRGVVVDELPVGRREGMKLENVVDRDKVAVLSLEASDLAQVGGSPARFIRASCPIEESVDDDETFLEVA